MSTFESDPDTISGRIQLLSARYDNLCQTDRTDKTNKDGSSDKTLTRENMLENEIMYLKKTINDQKDIIDKLRLFYQDLSITYNEKIDRLRAEHDKELRSMFVQFKERLSKFNNGEENDI